VIWEQTFRGFLDEQLIKRQLREADEAQRGPSLNKSGKFRKKTERRDLPRATPSQAILGRLRNYYDIISHIIIIIIIMIIIIITIIIIIIIMIMMMMMIIITIIIIIIIILYPYILTAHH
jgi:hypothetical protein